MEATSPALIVNSGTTKDKGKGKGKGKAPTVPDTSLRSPSPLLPAIEGNGDDIRLVFNQCVCLFLHCEREGAGN